MDVDGVAYIVGTSLLEELAFGTLCLQIHILLRHAQPWL